MSFILEALKKSEADRQRQSGPALFEVKVAPPRAGLPLWAVAIAVLLGVNLVIGVWMLLRHPAQPAAAPAFNARAKRGAQIGLPLYQDAAAAPGAGLPQLRLDLHVFAASPRERFVMINMHKLFEGDSLPEGVRVESITPDGAVLSHNGSQFLLPRN